MSSTGEEDEQGGAATVIAHHRLTGRYAALSSSDLDHIRSVVTDSRIQDKLSDLATPKDG